jgi:RNA polymerase sigma-70 factor (ECF subfamily)
VSIQLSETAPLAAGLAQGSPSAASIYESELSYVWNVLRRLGVSERELPDTCHDVFLKVFQRWYTYDPTRPLRPWLCGIALKVSAGARRKGAAQELPDAEQDVATGHAELHADQRGPEQAVVAAQEQALVRRALEVLSPKVRAVVMLHDLDGHSMPEVAEALRLRLNTGYSRLRLGRAQFVQELRRLQGERS